jgi:tetratricopeptide (TPR) repeat protein
VGLVESPERLGLITLLATVIVFGVGSAIDWTWFIPGTAVPALVCAGWLAGRGPLDAPVGRIGRARLRNPLAILGIAATAAIALLIAWTIAQPLRSSNADAAALTAVTRGDTSAAIADALRAARENPFSVDPLFELSAIYRASGDNAAAVAEMRRAVGRQPDNPDTWLQQGQLLLKLGRRGQALAAFSRAAKLDRDYAVALAIYEHHHHLR